ncbi:MAG: hypothetical protein MIO93_07240 [ANME-2 cluster archaeon]|jgi:predicted nucleic acid-binding protein|nr:hypothetical protein [ANME-2 cluster archaeon]
MKSYKPIVTVDTSSLIKWFKTEEDREWALESRKYSLRSHFLSLLGSIHFPDVKKLDRGTENQNG